MQLRGDLAQSWGLPDLSPTFFLWSPAANSTTAARRCGLGQFSAHLGSLGRRPQRSRPLRVRLFPRALPARRRQPGTLADPRSDALTDQIPVEADQEKRKALCSEVQKTPAEDLPYLFLWFTNVVSVHRRELGDLDVSPPGDYDFRAGLPCYMASSNTSG